MAVNAVDSFLFHPGDANVAITSMSVLNFLIIEELIQFLAGRYKFIPLSRSSINLLRSQFPTLWLCIPDRNDMADGSNLCVTGLFMNKVQRNR